ncbi:YkyA family protein [Sporosarcina aquimarina]|uniref:YkyA family protein n=1 Tax=Sporosarcina aquimarina TaxID=114975 RepID=A0ABU4FXC3_9BACL|nr:YkyA family protein [Sporosarcina aquimarina]MDW0109366.1 YkyA family protein [Sporosarcina aquimarina]
MQKMILAVSLCGLLTLGGCTENENEMQQELSEILNEVQTHEKEAADFETQLAAIEKKEQILFEKTLNLKVEDQNLVESNVTRMKTLLSERQELIEEERIIVDEAEKKAARLSDLPPAESDDGTRAVAKLKKALAERYELHHKVIEIYIEMTGRQLAVYNFLIDENVKRVKLEKAILLVNKTKAQLDDATQVFNQSTNEVNSALSETQQIETD